MSHGTDNLERIVRKRSEFDGDSVVHRIVRDAVKVNRRVERRKAAEFRRLAYASFVSEHDE